METLKTIGVVVLVIVLIVGGLYCYVSFVNIGLRKGYSQREAEKNASQGVIGVIVIILAIIIMTVN